MCGLYGVYQASGIDSAGLEIFNRLGKLSESRGRDSTGIISVERATIKKNKEFITRYRKGLTRASVFHESPEARSLIDGKPVVLAGHTRMATHGKVNIANAHPFEIGHLVGMHNGIYASLYDRENDKTDSRVIFEMLNTLGVPKGLRTINEDHHGYMALAFINKSSDTLNLFSNGGRSLFLGKTKTCGVGPQRNASFGHVQASGITSERFPRIPLLLARLASRSGGSLNTTTPLASVPFVLARRRSPSTTSRSNRT